MGTELTYAMVVELLPAYALGALESEEMEAVDAYLEEQHTLLARLERLDIATAQLAQAAPAAPMSPQIKTRLMTQVRAEGGSTTSASPVVSPIASSAVSSGNPLLGGGRQGRTILGQPVHTRPIQPPLPVQPPLSIQRPRRFDFGWLAAAALAAMALFIVWIDIGTQTQLRQLQNELVNRDTQLAELRQQQIFFTNPSQIVTLVGTGESNARGLFYQYNEEAFLVLHGLEPLPATQTYQLWLIPTEGTPASAAIFAVQSADESHQQVKLPANALTYNAVGISIEPSGGSLTPTMEKIVLLGEKA